MAAVVRRNIGRLHSRRATYAATAVAIAIAACTAIAGCASSSSSANGTGGSAAGPSPASTSLAGLKPLSLTVGLATPSAQNGDLFWAVGTGLFAKLGLNVTLDTSAGGNTASELATGQLVIGNSGVPQMFTPLASGRQMQLVFADTSGDGAAAITVSAKSPYKTIMDLSGKSVGTIGVNGASYGAASAYSQYIVAHGGKRLNLVVGASASADAASLVSGSIQAIVGSPSFAAGIAAGQFRQMLATNAPQAIAITGGRETASGYIGLSSSLASNSEAITRFVAGLRIAREEVGNASSSQVAAEFQKSAPFAPSVISLPDLTQQINQVRGFWAQNDLQISQAQWSVSLAAFSKWGLMSDTNAPLNLKSATFSYANVVNMAYWNAATPLVKAYDAKYGSH
jgi:ABC-type nitrate/sulfonate/bicarbonate transport system substrate-binding protein